MNQQRRLTRIMGWTLAIVLAGAAHAQNKNVTVDDQPTAEQRVGDVKALRKAGRVEQAVDLMQELIEGSRFKLVGLGDGNYADVERWCRSQLLSDPALRAAYRTRYSATAERDLAQASEGGPSIDALQDVYRRYTVTEAGLEAGMLLVGLLLESGEALSAKSLIGELMRHPDRQAVLDRLVYLSGAAAAYTQETDVAEDAVQRLGELGHDRRRDRLAELIGSVRAVAGVSRPALMDAGKKPQALDQPLWKQPIIGSSDAQSWVMRDVFTLPRLTASLALVNNGRQVVAFDRASGQRAWAYPDDEAAEAGRGRGALQQWRDARSVAYGGGMACAVLGECYGITDIRNPYVTPNRLVCIDPQTGRARWERASGVVLDNEPILDQDRRDGRVNLQFTHFVGTPVITRGKVLALLRRTSANNTQHTWVLCFDAEDGSLLWYRHLSILSLNGGRDVMATTPQIGVQGETAYITDGIATVGAIDIHSGGYQWLKVLPVGYGSTQRLTIKTRGVLSPPVLTRAGLLVSLSLIREPMILLDPEDGSVLQAFDQHPKLSSARYMLDAQDGAVVVSYESISFWHAMDAEVRWTFTLGPDEHTVGRGDVTAQYIVMPTNKRIVVLDRESGELIDQSPATDTSRATNIVARDGELFAIHDAKLSLYATWDSVFQRLVRRVKDAPGDPSGGIALASLALKQQGLEDEVLQGVGYALQAIEHQPADRAPQIREIVFNQLRTLTPLASRPGLRGALLDRMAQVSETAQQEAVYHLDAGLFHAEQGEAERAAGHFHAVLAEPAFASQPYERAGLTRPAGKVAEDRIRALVERFGPSVYARYDAMAQAWLEQIKSQGTPDAATLINIARRFPLSVDTVQILLEAAGLNAERGDRMEAASLYQQAVLRSTDTATRQRAVGTLLAFYLAGGQADHAIELIQRERRRDPALMPLDPETASPVSLERWQQRAEQVNAPPADRSQLGPVIGDPRELPGRLVASAPGLEPASNTQRFYLQQPDAVLACYRVGDLDRPAWSLDLPEDAGPLALLADGPEQALFWSAGQGVVIAIDPTSGQTLWRTAVPISPQPPRAQLILRGAADAPQDENLLITVSATVVCIGVPDNAELFAIDRTTGSTLWRKTLAMNRLTALQADQWTVIAAGPAGHANQARNGKLAVLDLFTGEPDRADMQDVVTLTPRAIHLAAGRLLVVGDSGVAEVDRATGRPQWLSRFQGGLIGPSAAVGGLIAVTGSESVVYLLDTTDNGEHLGQYLMRTAADDETILTHANNGQAFLAGGIGLVCLDPTGKARWQAATLSPPQQPVRLLLGQTHLAMLTTDQQADGFASGRGLAIYERDGGRLISQYSLDTLGDAIDPSAASHVGPLILLPAGDRTLVLPTQQAE